MQVEIRKHGSYDNLGEPINDILKGLDVYTQHSEKIETAIFNECIENPLYFFKYVYQKGKYKLNPYVADMIISVLYGNNVEFSCCRQLFGVTTAYKGLMIYNALNPFTFGEGCIGRKSIFIPENTISGKRIQKELADEISELPSFIQDKINMESDIVFFYTPDSMRGTIKFGESVCIFFDSYIPALKNFSSICTILKNMHFREDSIIVASHTFDIREKGFENGDIPSVFELSYVNEITNCNDYISMRCNVLDADYASISESIFLDTSPEKLCYSLFGIHLTDKSFSKSEYKEIIKWCLNYLKCAELSVDAQLSLVTLIFELKSNL